jgi:microcin C transport system substrate-binding protein
MRYLLVLSLLFSLLPAHALRAEPAREATPVTPKEAPVSAAPASEPKTTLPTTTPTAEKPATPSESVLTPPTPVTETKTPAPAATVAPPETTTPPAVTDATASTAPTATDTEAAPSAEPLPATERKHGLAMFDDLKYPPDFTHFDYVNPDAPKGDTVRYSELGTFDKLNPYTLKGMAAAGLELTSDTLMAGSADEPFSQYGLIAESVEVAPDRSWIIYHLRHNAYWQDSKKIMAEDVVFSYQTLMEKGHPFYKSIYTGIQGVEELDPYTVKFTFKDTTNRELPLITGQMPIFSKAYYTKHAFDAGNLDIPTSSGPYKIKEVKAGHYIIYERDPEYWGKDLPVNKGRYNFDQVRYDYYRDGMVAVEAFKAGEYDIREENISKVWATSYKDMPALKDGRVIQEAIAHERPSGMQAFLFNTRRAKFSDVRVRKALNYVFDFEWENRQLFYSAYQRTESYFANSPFASHGLPGEAELVLLEPYRDQLPEELFSEVFITPRTDGSGNNRANLKVANTLLNEAGWVLKDMKRVNAQTGEPMTIEFLLVQPSFERVVAPMVRSLERLGIQGKIRTIDSAQYQKRTDTFDFDIIIGSFPQSNSPGNELMDYWHSSRADTEGSQNQIGIKNPVVDALVEKMVTVPTRDELITTAHALDRVLLWNYYIIPNWHTRTFRMIYWNKFERPEIRPKYVLGLDTWWSKDAKKVPTSEAETPNP